MHETLTQQSDKKGKLKCTRHQRNNQTKGKAKMHETLTQQSDKEGKLKCTRHQPEIKTQQSGTKVN